MVSLQALRPLLTLTATTLCSLTFTSLIDCEPSLFLWDRWHGKNTLVNFYKDKNVWIVGASSGIGEELAYQLARAGCPNLILTSRHQDQLEMVADSCRQVSASCKCYCQTLDILNNKGGEELSRRFEDFIQNQLPPIPIDIVIFNAGAGQLQPSLETAPSAIQRIMDVNALWPMILTPLLYKHAVFRSLRNKDSKACVPHILVTNSIAAHLPVPLSSVYAASKAAQAHYFASLATEQPEQSIRIDMICPGPVETAFHQNHLKLLKNDSDKRTNEQDNENATTTKTAKSSSKMSVQRCVHLMVAAMARKISSAYQEIWVAPSPLISILFLQRLFPGLLQKLTTKFGQKRVQLFKEGKDLYDPKSWK